MGRWNLTRRGALARIAGGVVLGSSAAAGSAAAADGRSEDPVRVNVGYASDRGREGAGEQHLAEVLERVLVTAPLLLQDAELVLEVGQALGLGPRPIATRAPAHGCDDRSLTVRPAPN